VFLLVGAEKTTSPFLIKYAYTLADQGIGAWKGSVIHFFVK
jgi:hypothetical protein